MGIGFFYNEMEWTNKGIIKQLRSHGIKVEPIDINKFVLDTREKSKFKHRLYVNRVYPSSNKDSYNNIRFMLEITRHIENLGIPIMHDFDAAYTDYSKTESNNILEKHKIPTAHTLLFSNPEAAKKAANHLSFPKIVKMDCGGRALNVHKASSRREFLKCVSKIGKGQHLIHVEPLYKSKGNHATRITILNYKFVAATKKTLIRGWLGSSAQGATSTPYPDIPVKIRKLGEKVARIVKSKILSLDLIETAKGPVIVDINCTPRFHAENIKTLGFDPRKAIADIIYSEYKKAK